MKRERFLKNSLLRQKHQPTDASLSTLCLPPTTEATSPLMMLFHLLYLIMIINRGILIVVDPHRHHTSHHAMNDGAPAHRNQLG
jgi:hypothetical protein